MPQARSDSHDLQLSLPATIYDALQVQANQRHQPASLVACVAIEEWLKRQEAAELGRAISEYAVACAGTADDLDEEWEVAGLEEWTSLP